MSFGSVRSLVGISFHSFAPILENDYLAIRPGLNSNSATIILKRNPNELRLNSYNRPCLRAWRANILFVLDVYACAMYILSYISKAQKGMAQLLQRACYEARDARKF